MTVANEAAEQVLKDVEAFCAARPDVKPMDLAAHTSLTQSTCYGFFNGHLFGGHTKVAAEVRRVLTLAKAGDILRPGERPVEITERDEDRARPRKARDYYQVATTRAVETTLAYCAEHALIGVITGDYGVGKTEAVKRWRVGAGRKFDSVVYEFHEMTRGNRLSFLRSLGAVVGASSAGGSQQGDRMFDAVVERLTEHPALLILDQCETVSPQVMSLVRQIWDRTREAGVGVALLAAPVLMQRMQAAKIEDLGALTSRVAVWTRLRGLDRAEMAAVVKAEGIAEVEEEAFALWSRMVGGSMRRLMMSIELIAAKHRGRVVTVKTVEGVAGHLWGMSLRGVE